ncbi:VOC family protein [Streptomyces sulphureus]|uniref:VOC family protein n=1 Tax=Streptomyces sulphureus TaxID=47758 RepID=UPI000382454A|nr:VOC family protein [Streptomyces sulphureus]
MAAPVPQRLTPFLMFQNGRAQEAIDLYTSLFDDGEVLSLTRYGAGEEGAEGTVKHAVLGIAGEQLNLIDSPIEHGFSFTPAISLYVRCGTADEVDRLFSGLAEDGQVLMPLDEYGFSERFGWVADRFGVTWQVSLDGAETSD